MKQECAYYRELLTVGDWLDDQEKRMLAKHLETCPHCQADQELLQDLAAAFDPDNLPEPAPDLTDRIMAGVRRETTPVRTPRLTAILLFVLAGQLLLLACLRDAIAMTITRAMPLVDWLGTDFLAPLTASWQDNLTGLLSGLTAEALPAVTDLWLAAGVALLFLCLFAGRIFYTEERNHA